MPNNAEGRLEVLWLTKVPIKAVGHAAQGQVGGICRHKSSDLETVQLQKFTFDGQLPFRKCLQLYVKYVERKKQVIFGAT